MKLLEVQSSVRKDGSVSRSLSDEFVRMWRSHQPNALHKKRDISQNAPAHPTDLWVKANYTPPEARSPEMSEALKDSESLIEELLWADRLLLGVPMYNFSVPSTLKTYLDNVVRINRTFVFDPESNTFQGLSTGQKALIITPSAGDFVAGGPLGHMNFCDTYLHCVLGFIGIEDVTVVAVPNLFMGEEIKQKEIDTAKEKLMTIAVDW